MNSEEVKKKERNIRKKKRAYKRGNRQMHIYQIRVGGSSEEIG